jgi:DNA phosphorothioation-associated putative methyltransferase
VVRLFFNQAKIAYLYYPDFDTNPHPILHTKMIIYMGKATVSYQDYTNESNPPILHEKDQLITPDYPLFDTFHQLSEQERALGLFADYKAISLRQGWLSCLEKHSVKLDGHNISQQ